MEIPSYTFYTTRQLHKLHQQFTHPSATKLYELLKTDRKESVTSKTLRTLEKTSAECQPCQRIANSPTRFRVSLGSENVRFNSRVFLDIMYLDGKPELHLVDDATRLSATQFLESVSTVDIWESILYFWATLYTGLPHKFIVYQGSQFQKTFAELATLHDVSVKQTGSESHNSLEIGE